MKNVSYFSLLLLIFFVSCEPLEEDIDPIDDPEPITQSPGGGNGNNDPSTTFGIRHDVALAEYERAGNNNAPYEVGVVPDFSSVVKFCYSLDGSDQADFVATGTLISPEWVLTAGHNFFVADEQSSPAPASGVQVVLGNDPNASSNTIKVEQLVFHPTWISQNDGFFNGNDICLVKLATPITSLTPATINFTTDAEPIGQETWFVGYGDYSQQEGQNADLFSKRHAIQNVLDRRVDGVGSTANGVNYNGGLLAFDFDDPSGTINALGDDVVNEDEAQLGTGTSEATPKALEGSTVQGDSGGPIFVKVNDQWQVAGVLSGGASEPIANHKDSSYGDISIFIRTSSHQEWIKSVTGL